MGFRVDYVLFVIEIEILVVMFFNLFKRKGFVIDKLRVFRGRGREESEMILLVKEGCNILFVGIWL